MCIRDRTNSTRRPAQSLGADGLEACLAAISDAGLKPSDIDGLCAAGSLGASNISPQEGIGQVTPRYMFKALGLSGVNWTSDGTLLDAAEAVAAGSCDYALAWRCMTYPRGQRYGAVDPGQASGPSEFSYPYGYQISAAGAAGPPSRAVVYQRYMEKYGATRDHMATFIIHNREMALLNEKSFWANERPEPLTKEEVANIATLPTLDEARAKIVAIFKAPAQKIMSILLAPGSKIAILAHAKSKKN